MGHGYDEDLGDKLCVTIIATGFKTTPHTGLPNRAPIKKKMDLSEDRPTIITQEIDSPINTDQEVENNMISSVEEVGVDENTNESFVKRFVLEEEEVDHVSDIVNEEKGDYAPVENTIQPSKEIEKNDGKIRFVLEDDTVEDEPIEEVPVDENKDFEVKTISEDVASFPEESKLEEPKEISEERLDRIRKATQKLRSPLGLNEMENEPAYKRRNVELDDIKSSSDPSISRYTSMGK